MSASQPNVAILPNGAKLGLRPGRYPLTDLIWPKGEPDGIAGKTLADLSADDHLILFPTETMHLRPGFGTRAKISVMIMEPAAIHGHHLKRLRVTWRRFHRVLTCNEDLLRRIPNGVFFPVGGQWVHGKHHADTPKSRDCSLIASAKTSQAGHKLRHTIAGWAAAEGLPVDVMGGGYQPFDKKADGLESYRYSVVIENVQERNYFTEKMIDALLCTTVPIYWGCPNIGDFLDVSGMIICTDEADIKQALRSMSDADYQARRPAIAALNERANHFGDVLGRAADAVLG